MEKYLTLTQTTHPLVCMEAPHHLRAAARCRISAQLFFFVKNWHMTFHQTNPRLSECSHEELHLMTQQENDEAANDSENITAEEKTFSLSEKKHERATFCK